MVQAKDFAGLVAVRLFLGLCEGGLLPGLVRQDYVIARRIVVQLHSQDLVSQHNLQETRTPTSVCLCLPLYRLQAAEIKSSVSIFYASGMFFRSCLRGAISS